MKKTIFALVVLASLSWCCANVSHAQINLGFSIKIVPVEPVEVRPERPSNNHVWVEGEWVWQGGAYVRKPGYWAVPERDHVWVGGHWVRKPDGASYWEPGYWKKVDHMGVHMWLPEPVVVRPPQPSPGHVWVAGEWVWRGGNFVYQAGYWTVPAPNQYWVKGHWAQWPNGEWYWSAGYWKTIPQNVFVHTVPPEPVVVRPPQPSPQHVWIEGEWIWNNNGFTWHPGYWIVRDPHKVWVRGYWHQRQDGGWYWVGGHWNWV